MSARKWAQEYRVTALPDDLMDDWESLNYFVVRVVKTPWGWAICGNGRDVIWTKSARGGKWAWNMPHPLRRQHYRDSLIEALDEAERAAPLMTCANLSLDAWVARKRGHLEVVA